MRGRVSWLSVTPEPERELPEVVATLAAGGEPTRAAVEAEAARLERLVLRASQRRWLAYLRRVTRLIEDSAQDDDPVVAHARKLAIAIVSNHHNLLLALPGSGAARTASARDGLQRLIQDKPIEESHDHHC